MLCAPQSAASRAYVTSHATPKISYQSYSTGDEQEQASTVPLSAAIINELLAAGAAWNAIVEASAEEIRLSYYPNQACVNTRTLEFIQGKWRITAMGSACD